jgi:hypothetical protein
MKHVSRYDNSVSVTGKEKYTLVAHPLRTKVPTGKPSLMGRSPSMSVQRRISNNELKEPEETLLAMKHLQQERIRDQHLKMSKNSAGSSRLSSALPLI